jgi:apolipoprotein N-acyltransferase
LSTPSPLSTALSWRGALACLGGGAAAFHLAFTWPWAAGLIVFFLLALVQLSRLPTGRWAFRAGFLLGLLVYAPQLGFFWNIFSVAAIPLWCVLAFWLGLFVWLAGFARKNLPWAWACAFLPILWMGLEYFRGELYPLRFTWLSVGYAFAHAPVCLGWCGMYGWGFLMMSALSLALCLLRGRPPALVLVAGSVLAAGFSWIALSQGPTRPLSGAALRITGIQLEFPAEVEATNALTRALARYPQTDFFILSEYTLDGPPGRGLTNWCRAHLQSVMVGGKDELGGKRFFNTAFVVGTNGSIIFRQAKAQPIQFFNDGEAAPAQRAWASPWGLLGVCICYDLSYTRVTDRLARQGAQALLVPTMDVADWGAHEHRLHARVAPVRAAEYGLPLFRLASSGVSQVADRRGRITASAPFPGQGEILHGVLEIGPPARLPLDRWLVWPCVLLTGGMFLWGLVSAWQSRKPRPTKPG